TTTRSTRSSAAARTIPETSSAPTGSVRASRAIPALPGAHRISGRRGERESAWISACSRPPPPTTRTLGEDSDGANEVVDRDRAQRLVLGRPARAELERYARHRLLVGRLYDVDEVELAKRGPLRLDRGTELLDFAIDLLDAGGVVLDRLHPFGGERRKHDVCRHARLVPHAEDLCCRRHRPSPLEDQLALGR